MALKPALTSINNRRKQARLAPGRPVRLSVSLLRCLVRPFASLLYRLVNPFASLLRCVSGTAVHRYFSKPPQSRCVAVVSAAILVCSSFASGAGDAHLLLTEVCVAPAGAEFIEIWNPLGEPVGLESCFLTDDVTGNDNDYAFLTTGEASPSQYDFLAGFPAGSAIEPYEILVIAVNGSAFKEFFGFAPDFEITDDPGNTIPGLVEGCADCIGSQPGLTDDHEVVILFTWNGESSLVEDIDICLWGDGSEAVDKTGLSVEGEEYLPDTPVPEQDIVRAGFHPKGKSFQRRYTDEGSETKSGGNGLSGHDETSEPLSSTWTYDTACSPAIFSPVFAYDLAIPEGGLSVSPAAPVSGYEMSVRLSVLNEGGEDAVAAQAGLFFEGVSLEPAVTVPTLMPGESWELVSGSFTAPQADSYAVSARLDFTPDEDTSDNEALLRFRVIPPGGNGPRVVVNEIMANPAGYESGIPGGKSDEYVELFNADTCAVDLAGWMLTDGDDLDTLVSWSEGAGGETGCPECETTATVLLPGSYALVLDRDYSQGSRLYRIPAGTVLLTVKDEGPGESGYGLSAGSDPLVLYKEGTSTTEGIVSTYGTPVLSDDWTECDDNGLDAVPFEPRDGRPVERLDPGLADSDAAWVEGPEGGTPGSLNSRVPADTDLSFCGGAVTAEPPVPAAGAYTVISAEICNGGSGIHPGADVQLYLDGKLGGTPDGFLEPEELVSRPLNTGPVAENGSATVCFTILPPGEGRFRYYARLPADDRPENNLAYVDVSAGSVEPSVIINEYMNNPSTGGTEWVELLNIDTESIDLRGWRLGDAECSAIFVPDSETVNPVLDPDCFFIVCCCLEKFLDTHSGFPPGAQVVEQDDWFSLSVEKDVITLFDAAGFCVETVSYRDEWEGELNVKKGTSWERIDPWGQPSDGNNWWGSSAFSGSTPGRPNSILKQDDDGKIYLDAKPNPFSPDGDGFEDRTQITMRMPAKSLITLAVYDAAGRRMAVLLDEEPTMSEGIYWDGRDNEGRVLPIGIYVLHMTADGESVREAVTTFVIAKPLN